MCVPESFTERKWGSTIGDNDQGWYISLYYYSKQISVCVEKSQCWSGEAVWTGQLDASGSNIELRNGNQEIIKGTISTDFNVIDFGDFKWMELSSIPVTTSAPG